MKPLLTPFEESCLRQAVAEVDARQPAKLSTVDLYELAEHIGIGKARRIVNQQPEPNELID